ncbi:hypothetical protein [Christiangramia salexigens]|uniref:YbbR-like domain-containing protein n=1 Tax=Christiangramia salexigens TaxID=1913577 RepID=A0A1L3J1I0_9FLAO|nr:hypothetical protein [Christiangramia salexigens]APG58992.1 hypothetical protein LPB144_00600 [Christiangramia salexigens]
MSVLRRRTFKRSSIKTFSFFLVFSAVVWVLVQFSKTYTQLIEIPVVYLNAPLDKSLSDDKPEGVDLQIQDNGFSIFYYKLFNPELTIDLSEAKQRDSTLVYQLQDHLSQIESQLKVDFENSRIIQEEIVIPFQFRKEKVIKINSKIEVGYAVGFSADEPVELSPDSVRVSGPEKIIDTIQSVPTLSLRLKKVNQDIKGKVSLDTSKLGMLNFYADEVSYFQKVEKFTEGSVEIPVEVINVPENLNLAYFPKDVIVYYQVNLKRFESISGSDFRVVCDYAQVNEEDGFMIAQIVEKPNYIHNLRLNEKRIQFVIKR